VPGPFRCNGDCPAGATGPNDHESQWASRWYTGRGYLDASSTFPDRPQYRDPCASTGDANPSPLPGAHSHPTGGEPTSDTCRTGWRIGPSVTRVYSCCTWLGVITGQLESMSFF
jgi:hypothetical protein